jgi:ribosomal protein S18 acetylase RimI-like enzyme
LGAGVRLMARAATAADLAVVAQLFTDASATVATERGGAVFLHKEVLALPLVERLAGLLSDPARLVAVGVLEDAILGSALATVETLRDGTILARLEFLWVEPEAREVGLGEELLVLVRRWAQEAGATRLDAYALPGNREAKNFLEGAGFSARLIVMHRTLGEPGS